VGRAKLAGEDLGVDFDDFDGSSDAPPSPVSTSAAIVDHANSIRDDDLRGFAPQPITANRFTREEDRTDFGLLPPGVALNVAREMGRMKNNEWLPADVPASYVAKKFSEQRKHLAGSTRASPIAPALLAAAQPAIAVFNGLVRPLSETEGAWRFFYHGKIVHKRGFEAYLKQLLNECEGVECTGVWFETGGREKDRGE
jgi:hypothetical protein